MNSGAEQRKKQNQEFVAKRLDTYMNDMLVDILIEKPEDVLKFMAEWVSKKKFSERNPTSSTTVVNANTNYAAQTSTVRQPSSNVGDTTYHENSTKMGRLDGNPTPNANASNPNVDCDLNSRKLSKSFQSLTKLINH